MKKTFILLFVFYITLICCSCGHTTHDLEKFSSSPLPTNTPLEIMDAVPTTDAPAPPTNTPTITHSPAITPTPAPTELSTPAPSQTPLVSEAPTIPTNAPTQVSDITVPSVVPTNAPAQIPDITQSPELPTAIPIENITAQNWYEQMINSSILSTGSNGRFERFLQKLKNNEPVSIVAYGGSITEGAGAINFTYSYSDHFINSLLQTYPLTGSTYHNSGLGGTPSTVGLMRYQRDVLAPLGDTPDLVILEFAVNDYNEPTRGRAYEALIRTMLTQSEDTAVILLFSVFENKWNLQEQYIPLGEYYGLPMISIKNAIATAYSAGYMTDTDFFADIYHPTNYGHAIISDCLIALIEQAAGQAASNTTPIPPLALYGDDFYGLQFITSTAPMQATIHPGSFCDRDTNLQTFARTAKAAFPDNWMHTAESSNEAFRMELTCKNLLLTYKLSSSTDFGTCSVYLDGTFLTELNGYVNGAWNNTDTILLLDEATASHHVLEIRMSDGQETKNFTILGIGYTP